MSTIRHLRAAVWATLYAVAVPLAYGGQPAAPVEDAKGGMSDPGRQAQYRAGVAHREMQRAEYDAKLAEQDYINLADAHKAAQTRADELRSQTEGAKKKFDAARERLAAARRAYEKEVSGIDKAPPVRQ